MAQGLLTQEDGYLYGKDALMQPVLDAYSRTGRTPSPSDAARLGLLGYIAPVRSPYLDVDETSDDIRFEAAVPEFVKDAYGAVMSPMDVATGQISPEEGANRALNLIAVGGLMSSKPSGSLGIFGGRGSRTAPIGDFMIAERMAERGIHRDKIHRDTGIFLDPVDKQMKYEISDDQALLQDIDFYKSNDQGDILANLIGVTVPPKAENFARLDKVIDHPEFFKAYPELASTPTSAAVDPLKRGGTTRVMRDGSLSLEVFGKDLDEVRSILLHEMQHLVQQKEKGFGQGGNPQSAFRTAQQGLMKQERRATDAEISERDMARRERNILHRVERILKNEDITPRPRLLTGQSDWYKHGDKIRTELGPMPKRSGPKQKEWIKAAGKLLAQRQFNDDEYYNKNELNTALLEYRGKLPELKKAIRRAEYKANKLDTEDVRAADEARYRRNLLEMELRRVTGSYETGPFRLDIYRRLAGEVEARDVQSRRDFSRDERREKSPTQTRDVRPDQTYMTTNPAAGLLYQQNPYREDIFGRYQGGLL